MISFRNWAENTSCLLFFTYSLNHIWGPVLFLIISVQTQIQRTALGGNDKSKNLEARAKWLSTDMECMVFQWHQTFEIFKMSFGETLKQGLILSRHSHTHTDFLLNCGHSLILANLTASLRSNEISSWNLLIKVHIWTRLSPVLTSHTEVI